MIARRVVTSIDPRKTLHIKAGAHIPDIRYVRDDNKVIDLATMAKQEFKTVNLAKTFVRLELRAGRLKLGELVALHFESLKERRTRLAALHQAFNTRKQQREQELALASG